MSIHNDPYIVIKENLDHPDRYKDLTPEVQALLDKWIQVNFEPATRFYRNRSSYGLKHLFTRDTTEYIYNGAFKGAMLAAGYTPDDPREQNWFFKIKERIPDSFFGWAYARYRYIDTASGDFVRDMKADYRFPIQSISHAEIEGYLRHARHACPEALQAFNRIWKKFEHNKLGGVNNQERSNE